MREAGDPLKFVVAGLTLRQKQQRGDQKPSVPVADVFTLKSFYCLWNNNSISKLFTSLSGSFPSVLVSCQLS